jgi:undecaprenyl-diphosphatase
MVVIAFAYLLAGFKWIGIIGLSSWLVGLSRVYVGVHSHLMWLVLFLLDFFSAVY